MKAALATLALSLLGFFVLVPAIGGADVRQAPILYWTSGVQTSALLAIGVLLMRNRRHG